MDRQLIGESAAAPDRLRLTAPVYTVGRDLDCDVRLDDPSVSRAHARLFVRESHCSVEDLGSENGTFVNGDPLEEETTLSDGDVLRFGLVTFHFREAEPDVVTGGVGPGETAPRPGRRPRLQKLLEGRSEVDFRAQVREVASAWGDWLPFVGFSWRAKLLLLMIAVLGISALITGSLLNLQRRDDWIRRALFNLKPFAAENRAALLADDPTLLSGAEVADKTSWISDPVVMDADGVVLWPPDQAGREWHSWPDPIYAPGVEYYRMPPAPGEPESRPRLIVPITGAGRALGWVAATWDREAASVESSSWTIVLLMAAAALVLLYLVLEGTSAWVRRPILTMAADLRRSDPRQELVVHAPRDVPELRTLADSMIKVLRARSTGQQHQVAGPAPTVRSVIDDLPVPALLMDDRYRVVAANPAMWEALGAGPESLEAPPIGQLLPSSLEAAELSRTIKQCEPGSTDSCLIELGKPRRPYRALVRRSAGESAFEIALLLFGTERGGRP